VISKIDFVEYDKTFLEKSWEWLNIPIIKDLTNTPDFTKEAQLAWFKSLKSKNNYYIQGILYNKTPVGVVGLKNITEHDAEYWGYIGKVDFWGKGIDTNMMLYVLEKAKEKRLKKVYLTVLKKNDRAINLYRKFNFKQKSIKEKLIYMELDLTE